MAAIRLSGSGRSLRYKPYEPHRRRGKLAAQPAAEVSARPAENSLVRHFPDVTGVPMSRSPEPSRPRTPSGVSPPAGPPRPVPFPRLRPVPPADPPYDDERDPGYAPPPPTQGALALTYDLPWEAPASPEPASPEPA